MNWGKKYELLMAGFVGDSLHMVHGLTEIELGNNNSRDKNV
jgi:hypothetical protein